MPGVGSRFPSERSESIDVDTNQRVIRWTNSSSKDQHLYFTGPSITDDSQWLVTLSERDGNPNLYAIDRGSGDIVQLTSNQYGQLRSYAYPLGGMRGISKASPFLDSKRQRVYYIQDHEIWVVSIESPAPEKLCELPQSWYTAYIHGSCDGRWILVSVTPPELFPHSARLHLDQLIAVPRRIEELKQGSTLLWISTSSGRIDRELTLPFWCTHAQFCPDDSGDILLNKEGFIAVGTDQADVVCPQKPRIWLLDGDSNYFHPLYEESVDEWACHENWSASGKGVVYHGAKPMSPRLFDSDIELCAGRHFVAMRSRSGELIANCKLGIAVNHTVPAHEDMLFLSDCWDGRIALLDARQNSVAVKYFCRADSSCLDDQDNHVHPILSPLGTSVLFTSRSEGVANVFEVDM